MPHADLLPEPFKIIQTPRRSGVCTKWRPSSARSSPTAANSARSVAGMAGIFGRQMGWGHSGSRQHGIQRSRAWLDARGHGHSEDMRVEERFHRRDFGHMEVTVTITDPKDFHETGHDQFRRAASPDTMFSSTSAPKTKRIPRIFRAPPANNPILFQFQAAPAIPACDAGVRPPRSGDLVTDFSGGQVVKAIKVPDSDANPQVIVREHVGSSK